jgi:hypothetical protein
MKDNGYLTYTYEFEADKDMYFRLRGTNLPAGVPFETDAEGNPLADSEAEENLYDMDGEALAGYLFTDITDYVWTANWKMRPPASLMKLQRPMRTCGSTATPSTLT